MIASPEQVKERKSESNSEGEMGEEERLKQEEMEVKGMLGSLGQHKRTGEKKSKKIGHKGRRKCREGGGKG